MLKEHIVQAVEFAGVVVILFGGIAATVTWFMQWRHSGFDGAYRGYRSNLGRAILLGLEFLVAADI